MINKYGFATISIAYLMTLILITVVAIIDFNPSRETVFLLILIVILMGLLFLFKTGYQRVSEVHARFLSESMPLKLMAIDSDLRTGAISDEQAIEKSKNIQEQSIQFDSKSLELKNILILNGVNVIFIAFLILIYYVKTAQGDIGEARFIYILNSGLLEVNIFLAIANFYTYSITKKIRKGN